MMSSERQSEPRWPAFIALLAVGCLCLALPASLSLGPRWLLLAIVFTLLIPIAFFHRQGNITLTRILMVMACAIITIAMISSLIFLIEGLPKHREAPEALLRSATSLWITNFLVFALWYWEMDAGGPHGRDRLKGPLNSSFLFPQMLQPEKLGPRNLWTIYFSPLTPARHFRPQIPPCLDASPRSG
jgi:hypothetical protein